MGLFEIQRQLAGEARSKSGLADRTPARGGLDAFLGEAWQHVRDPPTVARLYEARARRDPDTALALARLAAGDPAALRALAEEQRPLVAPLVASGLFSDDPGAAADRLVELGEPRVVPLALELAAAARDDLRLRLADVAATWGDRDAQEEAAAYIPATFAPLTATLARHGHPAAHAALTTALRNFLNEWHKGGRTGAAAWPAAFAMVDAIVEGRVLAAAPLLIAALVTPLVPHALRGLGKLRVVRAREHARTILREVEGTDPARIWAYRLAAENCLSALGEPQPLATAHAALAAIRPIRRGYPRADDVLRIRTLALEALVERGGDDERARVAREINSDVRVVRQIAARALERLGRPPPALRWLDAPRCQTLDSDALAAALVDPHAVFARHAATALAAREDPRAVDWALDRLERAPDHRTADLTSDEPDHAELVALDVLVALRDLPSRRARVAATTSAWARRRLFDEAPIVAEPPAQAGPWRAGVARLDHPPFVFGARVEALALDAAGRRLAVVGDRLGQIVDATTGALQVVLALAAAPAHDCAFSPGGAALAVAAHGCRVDLFDATTGAHLRELPSYGAAPRATRRLAFSPDGELLAYCGSDGSAFVVRWRTAEVVWSTAPHDGAFAALAFSPDGSTCLFSHVKTDAGTRNYLLRLDLATRDVAVVRATSPVWSIARVGPRWYAGGAARRLGPLTRTLRRARTDTLAQTGVVRLAATPDGALLAASQDGLLQRWELADGQPRPLLADAGALAALAVAPDGTTYAAGDGGVVHRFTAAGAPLRAAAGEAHTAPIAGIAALPDGTTLTAGQDGRLLRWPRAPGPPVAVLRHDARLTGVVSDGVVAYAGSDGRVLAVDLAAPRVRSADLGDARASGLALAGDRLHVATTRGHVHTLATADLRELARVSVGHEATALALTAERTLLVGTDEGHLVELDADHETAWSRAEFGRDLVDRDPLGAPHRAVVGIVAHAGRFAAAATDDTLRVFDHAGHRRTLRLMTAVGPSGGCDLSPDGRLVAVTARGLCVFDATTGALLVQLTAAAFPGAGELTAIRFTAPRHVLVGARSGGLYVVTLEAP